MNVNTIEFSMIPQFDVNGDTPPTPDGNPIDCGEPPNTASMCGTLPGSTSVNATSKRENMFRMHATVASHTASLVFHAGTVRGELTIVDRLARESFCPGDTVTPLRFR